MVGLDNFNSYYDLQLKKVTGGHAHKCSLERLQTIRDSLHVGKQSEFHSALCIRELMQQTWEEPQRCSHVPNQWQCKGLWCI